MLYRSLLRPLLFRLPPETAHEVALRSLRLALGSARAHEIAADMFKTGAQFGALRRFGLSFSNPIGLAAGFDKNARAVPELATLGFGFIEIGTVTHQKQSGNARPRLFRLPQDKALINRLFFPPSFSPAVAARLAAQRRARNFSCLIGVNIGKSRVVAIEDAIPDYLASFELVWPHADYIAVNVSSPNTPNLRELQRADSLAALLKALQQRNKELANRAADTANNRSSVPLLVKIAPDLTEREIEAIIAAASRANIAGIIATNTTTTREGLRTPARNIAAYGAGGLSGAPLRARSTHTLALLYRLTQGRMPLVGVGGIFSASDAWEKISAGASLVQVYTGLIYEGPDIVRRINDGLGEILRREGFASLDEAIGCRAWQMAAA